MRLAHFMENQMTIFSGYQWYTVPHTHTNTGTNTMLQHAAVEHLYIAFYHWQIFVILFSHIFFHFEKFFQNRNNGQFLTNLIGLIDTCQLKQWLKICENNLLYQAAWFKLFSVDNNGTVPYTNVNTKIFSKMCSH